MHRLLCEHGLPLRRTRVFWVMWYVHGPTVADFSSSSFPGWLGRVPLLPAASEQPDHARSIRWSSGTYSFVKSSLNGECCSTEGEQNHQTLVILELIVYVEGKEEKKIRNS